jgi:Carboxypeptidase regulatory-like domain/TonB-dependent Receptor Plug Domain
MRRQVASGGGRRAPAAYGKRLPMGRLAGETVCPTRKTRACANYGGTGVPPVKAFLRTLLERNSRVLAVLTLFKLICFTAWGAEVILSGRVVDENDAPVHEARVTAHPPSASTAAPGNSWEAVSDAAGFFRLALPGPGDFLVSVEHEGYYPIKNRSVQVDTSQELTLALNTVREVFQSVDVNETPSPVDIAQTGNTERLTGTEVNDIPYANSHSLRNSLQLTPGLLEDPSGGLHVNGSSENQVLYLLNGFDITNPVSGQFQTVLAVEGIRSMDLSSGVYSPQYGKGSAGALSIATESGTDTFHYTATDFIPGLSEQQGLHLGNWYPRFGVSGPIVPGRAWFSDMFDSEYNQAIVTGLPKGQNTRSGWAGSNLLHTQANLTQSQILFADFLINIDNEGRVGLGPLNPISTTSNIHTREYFGSVKDQAYLGRGVLMEFGYAHNEFSSVQTPQGQSLYILAPSGQSGNYFVNGQQTSSRDEGTIHLYMPQLQWAGFHQIEAGADADLRRYDGDFHRTGYEVFGLSGQLLSETLFPAPAIFHVGDTGMSSYVRDTWRIAKPFQVDLGIREDWDERVRSLAWSPRATLSWSPFASGRTRISGGYAVTHDQVTLDLLSAPLDQVAVTTEYNPDGSPAGPPAPAKFVIGNASLVLPRATNWTFNADHRLSNRFYVSAKYLRRRGTDGFLFLNTLAPEAPPSLLPLPGGESGGLYQLTNLRRDNYDSELISVRQTLTGQHEWMVSYTHSRALSNAVIDPNSAQPLQALPDFVPMPWDAPNRFLGWAYLPLWGKNWSIAALADLRSGYPFSIREPSGLVVGTVDSYRYPVNFDLDIAIERMVILHGYRFALRGGVNNATDARNPTAVNNVVGAPQFLQFLGNEGRHFVVRIRFFGRAGAK